MSKYDFKLRLDLHRDSNEFVTDNILFLDVKNIEIEQFVKLVNLALNNPSKVKKPEFEIFNPEITTPTQRGKLSQKGKL